MPWLLRRRSSMPVDCFRNDTIGDSPAHLVVKGGWHGAPHCGCQWAFSPHSPVTAPIYWHRSTFDRAGYPARRAIEPNWPPTSRKMLVIPPKFASPSAPLGFFSTG